MTKTSLLNYNATSGGTQIYSVRPRLLFNNITLGKKYKITIKATNRSGTILLKLYDGSSYIIDNNDLSSDIDLTFVAQSSSTVQFNFDGREVFNVDLEISLKEVINADFDFSRPTTGSATGIGSRENSSGNIESVAANLPRIDYLGGTGHILLEPQSTNTATYSNDFTQGDIFNGSGNPGVDAGVLTSQQAISPDGTNNAWLLKDSNSGGNGQPNLRFFTTSVTSNDFNTVSIFAKKALTNDFIVLSSAGFDASANGDSWFNISNGSLGTIDSDHTAKIEDYGNGWYRCEITFKTTTDTQGAVRIRLAVIDGSVSVPLDGTNGSYLFGLQCEADASRDFATSYIPTSGSTVTRSADAANNAGSSDLINSTEGVLYAEIAALNESQAVKALSISDRSLDNRVLIALPDGELRGQFQSSASNITINTSGVTIEEFNKIACCYTSTTFKVFVNGTQIATTYTSLTELTGLSELAFDRGDGGLDFYGKVKSVAVFKEALTDEELTCLTT
jgi:hypothetical protein